ncbi:MAG: DUF4395 family protein [Nitrospirae bacterium]|nr:DUF4395 family protein [Nitrospirota bacterium]
MERSVQLNFIQQQGFRNATASDCEFQYLALMVQPRLIGIIVVSSIIFQSWPLFLILSAVLWGSAFLPAKNPFDALYNGLIAGPKGLPRLTPAPGPRRFAQGMAASFMLGISLSILFEWHVAAWILEGFLAVALGALIFGKFCLGSYTFLLLRGEAAFAKRTLPWSRSTERCRVRRFVTRARATMTRSGR